MPCTSSGRITRLSVIRTRFAPSSIPSIIGTEGP
jgi:hypothetical protein